MFFGLPSFGRLIHFLCGVKEEIRNVSTALKERIFSSTVQERLWVVCPDRQITDIIPCVNYWKPKTNEFELCSQDGRNSDELKGLMNIK